MIKQPGYDCQAVFITHRGGIGRRVGLKIPFSQESESSSLFGEIGGRVERIHKPHRVHIPKIAGSTPVLRNLKDVDGDT